MALFDDELRKAQQQRAMYNAQLRANQAQADYDALMPQAMAKINQAQQGPSNPLESVLSGIGNSIKNVGTGLMDLFGTGGAAVGDAIESIKTGKATTKNQDDYRKWLYNTDSVKDAATKGLGTGLDAAATLTDFIPGLGTAAKVGLNVGQGVASGIANPLIEKGSQATLEDAMKGALVGGASAGVGQYVGGKLANRTAGKGLISKALNSNVGKGAITGGIAGATGGGLYAGLNGGDVLGGALQGAQGGAMAGGTMAGTMGLIGSGIDRLNRKYNAAPQTPDVPTTKPIVDEVAEQYIKPSAIETALQEAQMPTRRQIDVQYDGSNNGNVAVNRQRNMYRLPDRSGSTLDGILGPNNKLQLPNTQRPTNPYAKMTDIEVLNDISPSESGAAYKSLADAIQSGDFLGNDPKGVMAFLKEELPKETYDNIQNAIQERVDLDNMWAGEAYGVSKGELPYLNRDEYYRDTIGRLGNKGNGNLRAEDVPESMYNRLRNSAGKNSLGGNMTDNEGILRELFGNAAEGKDKYELYDMYQQVAEAPGPRTYDMDDITAAVTNSEYNNNIGDQALNAIVAPFRQDAQPTSRQIGVQGAPSIADSIDVSSPNRGQLIQDVMPAQRRQAQPQVQAQPIQEAAPAPAPVYRTASADMAPETSSNSSLVGRALKNAGNDLQAAQTNITRAERRKFGIKDAGETVNTLRKRTGFSNLDDQAEFAKNITGGQNSIMDDILRYNISVDESGKPITLRTDQYEVAINDAVGKEWKKSVMGKDYDQFRKDLIADIQNQDPITAANWLKREAATQRGIAEGKGPTADKAARKAKIYTEVANKVDDLTYSAVPQKNINRMFDDTIDEFKTRASEAKAAGNKKYADAYERLADELSKTERTIAKYRSFKKDFVKSSQLAEISRGAQSGSLEAGYKRGNVIGRVVNTIAEEPINRALAYAGGKLSDLGDAVDGSSAGLAGAAAGKAGRAAGKAVKMLNNDTFSNARLGGNVGDGYNMPSFGEIGTRQLARQAGLGAMQQQDRNARIQDATQEAQDVQSNYENSMLQAQQMYNQAQQAQAAGSDALDRISSGMERALAAGDIEAYGQLANLYKQAAQIYELQNPTATKSEAKALSDNQAKALTGLQQLQTLEQMTPDLGTALSGTPLGGLVDMLGGNDYNNQAQSLALTLGYLQSGKNVTPREAERTGRAYIPTAFDSETVKRNKLSRAEQLLRNYLADTTALEEQ